MEGRLQLTAASASIPPPSEAYNSQYWDCPVRASRVIVPDPFRATIIFDFRDEDGDMQWVSAPQNYAEYVKFAQQRIRGMSRFRCALFDNVLSMWLDKPASKKLIALLLQIAGIELNPGPPKVWRVRHLPLPAKLENEPHVALEGAPAEKIAKRQLGEDLILGDGRKIKEKRPWRKSACPPVDPRPREVYVVPEPQIIPEELPEPEPEPEEIEPPPTNVRIGDYMFDLVVKNGKNTEKLLQKPAFSGSALAILVVVILTSLACTALLVWAIVNLEYNTIYSTVPGFCKKVNAISPKCIGAILSRKFDRPCWQSKNMVSCPPRWATSLYRWWRADVQKIGIEVDAFSNYDKVEAPSDMCYGTCYTPRFHIADEILEVRREVWSHLRMQLAVGLFLLSQLFALCMCLIIRYKTIAYCRQLTADSNEILRLAEQARPLQDVSREAVSKFTEYTNLSVTVALCRWNGSVWINIEGIERSFMTIWYPRYFVSNLRVPTRITASVIAALNRVSVRSEETIEAAADQSVRGLRSYMNLASADEFSNLTGDLTVAALHFTRVNRYASSGNWLRGDL